MTEARMPFDPGPELTASEQSDLRRLAGIMLPPSHEYQVPGADDEAIFADIVQSLGRDRPAVRQALADLRSLAGGDFSGLEAAAAQAAADLLLQRDGAVIHALGRAVLQCYYRDHRVARSLGRNPGPPFPKGHVLESGDFGLLDMVRKRPRMWRDLDGFGGENT
jgi:hypothetical protein